MEIKGILKACVSSQKGVSERTGNPWRTDEYLIVVPGQYEKKICVEVRGEERCKGWENFFKGLQDNTPVLVKFEINARQYQDRWYNSIEAWNIEVTTW